LYQLACDIGGFPSKDRHVLKTTWESLKRKQNRDKEKKLKFVISSDEKKLLFDLYNNSNGISYPNSNDHSLPNDTPLNEDDDYYDVLVDISTESDSVIGGIEGAVHDVDGGDCTAVCMDVVGNGTGSVDKSSGPKCG
jgi:hypothetical protein